MNRKIKYTILLFAIVIFSYWCTLVATPYAILLAIKIGSKSTLNQPVYANVMTEKDRQVVMPNPDFLYVACGYDIRKSPIRITGIMPEDSYCSLALYTSNTLNFYIQNDRQTKNKKVDLLLVKKGEEANYKESNDKVIISPTKVGVMLVRILINDTSKLDYYKNIQRSYLITPLK